MNITQADECVLSGEWRTILHDIADAMRRYRDNGPVRKGSEIYDTWTERADLLEEATEI